MTRLFPFALTISLLSIPAGAKDTSDKVVFEKICGACHTSSMVTDFMTREQWNETIEHMIINGAKGSRQEFAQVRSYLARNMTRVNINTANAQEIGAALQLSGNQARSIVDHRSKKGAFTGPEDLEKIPGIDANTIRVNKQKLAFR